MNEFAIVPKAAVVRRRRFQKGSLQKRKSAGCGQWIAFWWEDHHRKSQILGPCSIMSRAEALAEMARVLRPVNDRAGEPIMRVWIVDDWIRDAFLPFIRRQWKLSTASTSGDRIRTHLIADFQSAPGRCQRTPGEECMRRPILNHTLAGEVVYDPFLGSGTSIIAAETTGRICIGLEIDAVYCDVIVERWEQFTGNKAVRHGG